jgi:drug/metabolite transporter (DMT)-like permease
VANRPAGARSTYHRPVSTVGRPDRATVLAFAGVVLFGGLNTIAVKETVAELDPEWGAGLRFLIAGLLLAALTLVGRRSFPRGRGLVGAMVYGLFGFAASFGLVYPALRSTQAGTAAVVIALSPLATYILAVAQRQERFRPMSLLGALVALLGIAIVFLDQAGATISLGPLVLIFVGMVCLSEAGVIVKWVPRSDPIATNAVAMLTAAVVLIVASFVLGESRTIPTRSTTWIAVAYIVVFGSVAMFSLYLFGLGRWTASGMSYSTLLLPFVSVTVATLLIGEQFSIAFVVGGVVMLVGVYLGAFGVHRPNRSTATSQPECLPAADCGDAIPAALRSSGQGA